MNEPDSSLEKCNEEVAAIRKEPNTKVLLNRVLSWYVIFLIMLYIWNQSHLQLHLYWTSEFGARLILFFLLVMTIIGAMVGSTRKLLIPLFSFVGGYFILCGVFGFLSVYCGKGHSFFYIKAMITCVFMIWVLSRVRLIKGLIWMNYSLGFVLIVLNSLTLLHWFKWIELKYEVVGRVGGNSWEFWLNPYHFGLFGLTENYIPVRSITGTARLQGWSSEPLHWAYFVLLTISCACLLLSMKQRSIVRILLKISIVFIGIHSFFIQSSTMVLSILAVFLSVSAFILFRKLHLGNRLTVWLMFLLLIIIPGIIIPFSLNSIPNILDFFLQDKILGEGSNWEDKFNFLTLGNDLYYRFFPSQYTHTSSHNLILEKYIDGGLFMLLPFLCYLFSMIKVIVNKRSVWLLIASIVAIIANTITGPGAFFYPSGAMWFMLVIGVTFYRQELFNPTQKNGF